MLYWQLGADALKAQFPETWEHTGVAIIPAGPSGHSGSYAAANPIYIHSKTKYPEACKKFLLFWFRPEIYGEWIEGSGWVPGLNAAWENQPEAEWREVTKEQMKTMSRGFDPYGADPKNGAATESWAMVKAIQDVIVNNMSPEDAIANAAKTYEAIYNGN
jgi:multiple sugar transport system substrate-binding protein